MQIRLTRSVGIALSLASFHCASATAVTPAPVSAEEAPKLQAALLGTCQVTATQEPGGEIKEAEGIFWTFADGGKLHQRAMSPFGAVDSDFTYRLDGRNIVSDGTFKTMRVDGYAGNTLKLFIYELTETYYCTKG